MIYKPERHRVPVHIIWSDWKLGALPKSGEYSTLARFPGEDITREAWSIVLTFAPSAKAIGVREWSGQAEFLSETGPWERLSPGAEFEMMEGRRVSARVRVC